MRSGRPRILYTHAIVPSHARFRNIAAGPRHSRRDLLWLRMSFRAFAPRVATDATLFCRRPLNTSSRRSPKKKSNAAYKTSTTGEEPGCAAVKKYG
ncbi:hypothetical protein MRX96_019040 [Rhipicephalus microplus]